MTTKLRISDLLTLPLDWMTLATVVYGARGSGKTTLGSVIAEEVTKARQRFVAVDLKGDWYGLKSTADGKSEAIPVVVWGGDHADVPLEPDAGAFVAETVAGMGQSCILDFEQFSKGKQVRFLAQFFETLYDRNREPLLLLLDEAQRYAPQKPIDPDAAKCLGAVEDLVKLGRKHGIGPVLFTQRGSGLNKEVSELCDMMVAFRTPGPLDQDRVRGWLEANTTKAQMLDVMGSLSGLATGTAVFASGHPDLKVFGTFAVRRRETFDSSATPKVGHRKVEPKRLAKPDLEALRTKMAAAIERRKADDPVELRRTIATLRKELLGAQKVAPLPRVEVETVRVPVLKDGQLDRAERMVNALGLVSDKVSGLLSELHEITTPLASALSAVSSMVPPRRGAAGAGNPSDVGSFGGTAVRAATPRPVPSTARQLGRSAVKAEGRQATVRSGEPRVTEGITSRQQRFLDAAATLTTLGVEVSRETVAGWIGVHPRGGSVGEELKALVDAGLIELDRGAITVTERGSSASGYIDPNAAIARATEALSPRQRRIFELVTRAYPSETTRTAVAEAMGIHERGGSFGEDIGRLRGRGLITAERGVLRARDFLFAGAR